MEIGANSVIIGDIKIGNNSIIAAGSIVLKDVPTNVIVAGNPAKIVKYLKSYKWKKYWWLVRDQNQMEELQK